MIHYFWVRVEIIIFIVFGIICKDSKRTLLLDVVVMPYLFFYVEGYDLIILLSYTKYPRIDGTFWGFIIINLSTFINFDIVWNPFFGYTEIVSP